MSEPMAPWKEEALADFRDWLEALPEPGSGAEAGLDPRLDAGVDSPDGGPDLHTLLREMAGLRQELKLMNREQARASRELERATADGSEARVLFREAARDLGGLEERLRAETLRRCVLPFLDAGDALARGHAAAARAAAPRGIGRLLGPARGVAELLQGYALALERFDRALAELGIRRVPALARGFDPRTMSALEARLDANQADGTVLAELRPGYQWGAEVLRLAEVVVSRRSDAAAGGGR